MGWTFGGSTIVSDTASGAYTGGGRFLRGGIDSEWYERSFPDGSGIEEIFGGDRKRTHQLACTWFSTNEGTLVTGIESFKDQLYRVLTDGTVSYTCRLAEVRWAEGRDKGINSNGTTVTVVRAVLIFVQTRP